MNSVILTLNSPSPDQHDSDAWIVREGGVRMELGATCSFGRSSANNVVISDSKTSRRHATIHQRAPGEYWIADLGSINGTWINGRLVVHPTQIFDGDQIGIGKALFVFHQPQRANSRLPRSDSGGTVRDVREEACWMLVADIAESTPLSRSMSPTDFAAMVAEWMTRCHTVVQTYSGQLNRWQGDSLFAIWPEAVPTAAQVASTMWGLAEYFQECKISSRIAVHRGKVAFGGANSSGEENLFGSEVNFIFRLEKLGARLREPVVVSAAAAGLLQAQFPTKVCGPFLLKGFPGKHECWVLPTSRRVIPVESQEAGESTFMS